MRQETGRWRGVCGVALLLAGPLVWPTWAQALTISDVRARSLLGEPLRLEAMLSELGPVPAAEIDVSLAWAEDYERQGIPYPEWGEQLRFFLVQAPGGRAQLFMTAPEQMTASGLTLLLRVVWPGHLSLLQIYAHIPDPVRPQPAQPVTLPAPAAPAPPAPVVVETPPAANQPASSFYLPDPAWVPYQPEPEPEPVPVPVAPAAPAAVPPPSVAAAPRSRPMPAPLAEPKPESRPQPVSRPAPSAPVLRSLSADGMRQLRVHPGDTLSQLARAWRVPGLSAAQRQQLIARNNPQAFIGGDINRLRADAVLQLPDLGKLPEEPETVEKLSRPAEVAPPAMPQPAPGRSQARLTLIAPGTGAVGTAGQGGERQGAQGQGGGSGGQGEAQALAASEAQRQGLLLQRDQLRLRLSTLDALSDEQDRRLQLLDARLAAFNQMPEASGPALTQARARQQVLMWATVVMLLAALLAFFFFRRPRADQDSLLDRG